jgi:hypothetical protein
MIQVHMLVCENSWISTDCWRLLVIKGKVYPTTGHEGLGRELRYSYTLSLTLMLDGGEWSKPRPAALPPGKTPVPIV